MNVIYAIICIAGWAWCVLAAIYLAIRLRRHA